MPRKKKEATPAAVSTIAAVAAGLGVDQRTVKDWLAVGCPGKKEGAYDLDAIRAWRAATRKAPRVTEGDRAKWETRKARAEARTKELELRLRRGQLISVATAAQIVKQQIAEVRTHLDQLPDFVCSAVKLAAEPRKRLRDKVRTKIADLLAALEQSQRRMAAAARREGKAEREDE